MIKSLKNGIKIVYEKNEHIRSATFGIWVKNGSRYEDKNNNGISHFIEHMFFKGTTSRTAKDIAHEMDAIGGQVNAFTTKECTCFYSKSLDIHLDKSLDILCDMFLNSTLSDEDIDLERTVILEEISMYEDQPDDLSFEKLHEDVFKSSSLGFSILGDKESLYKINSKIMHEYIENNFTADRIIISLVGSFEDKHLDKISRCFENLKSGEKVEIKPAKYEKSYRFIQKDIEQNHITIGFEGLCVSDDKRYALNILNGVIGVGMSSRLFQKIREEQGLCYTVSSFISANFDCGLFGIYLALSSQTEEKALILINEILCDILENGITASELEIQREQIKANVLMGLESTSAKMNFYARSLINRGEILTEDEIIEKYDEVTKEDVHNIAKEIINFGNYSICVVGKTEEVEDYKNIFKKI